MPPSTNIKRIYHLDLIRSFPKNKYVIIGSALLVLHGLLEKNTDLDIVADKSLMNTIKKDVNYNPVNKNGDIFYEHSNSIIEISETLSVTGQSFKSLYKKAITTPEGYNFMSWQDLYNMYKKLNRPKDQPKLHIIKMFCNQNNIPLII